MKTVLCVVGARPNFMKIAPVMRAFADPIYNLRGVLLHTGQHYDADMKASFFDQLQIPEPDIDLGVGSGSHAVQTAEIMKRFEPVLDDVKPDVVLVVGDVNSTIACALVAVKKNVRVVHVEAGLRSNDRSMPEEINRILTDQLSDRLYTTERCALANLEHEGIAADRVEFVGNVMIDTLLHNLPNAVEASATVRQHEGDSASTLMAEGYGVMTLHRPSNVDEPLVLKRLLETLVSISQRLPLVFPVHPRTRAKIAEAGLEELLNSGRIVTLPPQGYLQMLGLMKDAKVVLSDSGGIQEETTALGVPCITLRENTERPITLTEGTNSLAGTDPAKIRAIFDEIMTSGGKAGAIPEMWDGQAARRIAASLQRFLEA